MPIVVQAVWWSLAVFAGMRKWSEYKEQKDIYEERLNIYKYILTYEYVVQELFYH